MYLYIVYTIYYRSYFLILFYSYFSHFFINN